MDGWKGEMQLQRRRGLAEMVRQSEERQKEIEMLRQQRMGAVHGNMQEQAVLEETMQEEAPLVQNMKTDTAITDTAPVQLPQESWKERKKRQERTKAFRKMDEQKEKAVHREAALLEQRKEMQESDELTRKQKSAEKDALKEKLKAVDREEKAKLLEARDRNAADRAEETGRSEEENSRLEKVRKLEIQHAAQAERARLLGEYARMLPVDSWARGLAMHTKEKQEIEAYRLRRRLKVAKIENKAEREREEATLSRHALYDKAKKVFREENPLSHEDASWELPNGHVIVNVGRAFFGGTKPMYIFEDRSEPIHEEGQPVRYKQYLFKEAVNCIGWYKPEGALMTEAASQLQKRICGEYSIPAYACQKGGRVLGSFQEKVETKNQGIDLFAWQANPQDTLSPEMKSEILREHVLDWLLCNFDTKGENFLHRTDGHLSSFDKEASFSKLSDPGAAEMSTTYKPHANNTLYNVLFGEFAAGRVTLDLSAQLPYIDLVESISDEEYKKIFAPVLEHKYGHGKKRDEVEAAILKRKTTLRSTYDKFRTQLLQERERALGGAADK